MEFGILTSAYRCEAPIVRKQKCVCTVHGRVCVSLMDDGSLRLQPAGQNRRRVDACLISEDAVRQDRLAKQTPVRLTLSAGREQPGRRELRLFIL